MESRRKPLLGQQDSDVEVLREVVKPLLV